MVVLAITSIILVIADYAGAININIGLWMWIDNGILIIFAIDYFTRLILAKDKKHFLKKISLTYSLLFQLIAYSPFLELHEFPEPLV